MLAIRGIQSRIANCLIDDCITKSDEDKIVGVERNTLPPIEAERYFFCQGLLQGKRRINQTSDEISDAYKVNYVCVASMCDYVLDRNPIARICVMGSESGIVGSYDEVYADSKRLLHHYVETRKLGPFQQLVCVAPSIVSDAGMTLRRADVDNLEKLRKNHPKQRFLRSIEVARMVYFLLYQDQGYTTSVVIRMNGGRHVL